MKSGTQLLIQRGMTLIEIMLVLAIASSLLIMGIRQYQSFQMQQQFQQVAYNVDLIFQGLSHYYQGQCQTGEDYYSGTIASTGLLDASVSNATPLAMDISTQLVTPGYLVQTLALSEIVDSSVGFGGYFAQFNLAATTAPSASRTETVTFDGATSSTVTAGTAYFWKEQVAIKVRDTTKVTAYLNALGADCRSDLVGDIVTPCATSANEGDYLVWERPPSFALPNAISDLWATMPVAKDFNNVFRHDAFFEINNPIIAVPNAPYYLCGG